MNISGSELTITIIGICALVAWIYSVYLFVNRAKEKDPKMETSGFLWFIGLFASPIVLGIYVIAMKDVSAEKSEGKTARDELPSV